MWTYYGASSELLIVGGHHDTVYHAPGAVDDTSGTATVLEMAAMFSEYIAKNGEPTEQSDSVHGEAKKKDCGARLRSRGI